ncbi:hypothetical protein HY638_04340 [Candidatus Woesearchaeota archaeon]|nr:hypothetical protein [Candidatus Woesearchaeota archaeon]
MIEFIMIAALIAFAIIVLFPFITSSLLVFVINFAILAILAFRIPGDIKKRGLYPYYILSMIFATFVLVLSKTSFISAMFQFFRELLLLRVTFTAVMIFLFAHLFSAIGKKIPGKHGKVHK